MIEPTFDDLLESAWVGYRELLASRLLALASNGIAFTIARSDQISDDHRGTVKFFRADDGHLRAVISGTSDEIVFDVQGCEAERLANSAVHFLRDVWEVLHPVYLDDLLITTEPEHTADTAVLAVGHEQMLSLVVGALEQMRGEPITLDADKDYRLPTTIPSWLRVLRDSPSVRFFALITDNVGDMAHAADYIARNADKWPFISIVLDNSGVHAQFTHQMWMFHRKNLAAALSTWADFLRDTAPTIIREVAKVGDADTLPDALVAMMQVEAAGPELTPAEVARICHHDSAEILEYIGFCEKQGWERTANQLRLALRLALLDDSTTSSQRLVE